MSCSASLSSSTSRQPRSPRNGQGFDDCADDETASEILHNRAIRIRHKVEKAVSRPRRFGGARRASPSWLKPLASVLGHRATGLENAAVGHLEDYSRIIL
jgi:hypothetical protein